MDNIIRDLDILGVQDEIQYQVNLENEKSSEFYSEGYRDLLNWNDDLPEFKVVKAHGNITNRPGSIIFYYLVVNIKNHGTVTIRGNRNPYNGLNYFDIIIKDVEKLGVNLTILSFEGPFKILQEKFKLIVEGKIRLSRYN